MSISTFSSGHFNQAVSEAKKAAMQGPVFITDRGRPAHVLMRMEHYQSLTSSQATIADLLFMPAMQGLNLEIPRIDERVRPADFS